MQPSAEIARMHARVRFVARARNPLRRSCASSARSAGESAICPTRATLCGDRACRVSEMQARGRLAASLLEEVSYETLVLETCRFTFGGSLVRSARFGDLPLHFWRKSRTKRAFWRLGASLLDARFGDWALHFWRKSRTKRSFWRLGTALVELDSDLASS